ncbi:hypothetical protein DLP05_013 [Stenotrophomonas phage vB_SmaS_DLP_5]|uniref:Uncharacterized protein n=1 Tax=Stenotrophomonas phage vB_SmaS_DLP_5 TaxID=2044561 RepID=A0A2D2W332_9CAUD|nr:hypothetical protein FDJ07_gp012 [Stenotrophomonas phage vB_SmaS_DLP_5]ATS92376.1 hypothetical protein DLP05_013 [Stenotrophomonas phage vB_SmaS_DLP_5]
MALKDLKYVGYGGTGLTDKLPDAVRQLQTFKQAIVDGAAANTNIAVAGITTKAHILSVADLTTPAMVTAAATLPSNGNIRIAGDTTGKKLLVTYLAG